MPSDAAELAVFLEAAHLGALLVGHGRDGHGSNCEASPPAEPDQQQADGQDPALASTSIALNSTTMPTIAATSPIPTTRLGEAAGASGCRRRDQHHDGERR